MSQLEEIRKRLEAEEAFESSAEVGLNLLAALEAVEVELADLDELQAEHASFFDGANVSAGSVAKVIRKAITEALA